MGRPLVKRVLQVFGSLVVVATVWTLAYWLSVGRPPLLALVLSDYSRQELGGSWELLVRTSSLDSGYQAFVARKRGTFTRSIVGRYVAQAVYLREDCVAFETSDSDGSHVYSVACGDLDPVEIARSAEQGNLTSKGLERTEPDGSVSLRSQDDLVRSAKSQTAH